MEWKFDEYNQVPKGTIILQKGEPANVLLLLLKGRVAVYDDNISYIATSGFVLGLIALEQEKNRANYIAMENCVLLAWNGNQRATLKEGVEKNSNYASTLAIIMGRQINEMKKLYRILLESSFVNGKFLINSYGKYLASGNDTRAVIQPIPAIAALEPYEGQFEKKHGLEASYYVASAGIPQNIQKAYFASSIPVTVHYICEGGKLMQAYIKECGRLMQYNEKLLNIMFSDREDCFFKRAAKRLTYLAQFGETSKDVLQVFSELRQKIIEVETIIKRNKFRAKLPDHDSMERLYQNVISGESAGGQSSGGMATPEQIMRETENTSEKLLDFAGADDTLREKVLRTLTDFRAMNNKSATDDQSRALRREIQDWFFQLYESVFMREYQEQTGEKYVSMFLNYGVVDEKLLAKEEIMELYYLEIHDESNSEYPVYTMNQWLTQIMNGNKMPSKNEFNMDYEEYLRDMKKTNSFASPEEEKDYHENPIRKVQFEIKNIFRLNARVLSGQPVVAVPFLHSDALQGNGVSAMRLTAQRLKETFNELRETDVTLFARERMYAENELKLSKAYVVETVLPEIILFPQSGTTAVMWQEISGRRKNTRARFLFPILFGGMLPNTCTHVAGQFRWELVRTIQGTAWNDFRTKSLTSEYADYIQFYKKNRDLSEDRKEKLKSQLSKCRNNMREVFSEDYEIWVRSEANGAMRLTKPVREIMATYCPFHPEIRKRLAGQPAFADAMKRYTIFQMEKTKELANVIREYDRQNKELPDILQETKKYYDKT